MSNNQLANEIESKSKNVQSQNGKQSDNQRERIRITNENPRPFDGSVDTIFERTNSLATYINSAFSKVFDDWYGSRLYVEGPTIKVVMFFEPKTEPTKKCAIVSTHPNSNNNGGGVVSLIQSSIARKDGGKNFKLTDYAAEILYDFVYGSLKRNFGGGVDPFKPESYFHLIQETAAPTNGWGINNKAMCVIDGIDIYKVLEFLYGRNKPGTKDRYMYCINPVKVVNPQIGTNNVPSANWIVSINRITEAEWGQIMNNKFGSDIVGNGVAITDRV